MPTETALTPLPYEVPANHPTTEHRFWPGGWFKPDTFKKVPLSPRQIEQWAIRQAVQKFIASGFPIGTEFEWLGGPAMVTRRDQYEGTVVSYREARGRVSDRVFSDHLLLALRGFTYPENPYKEGL
jgi:hypothetical protein